MTSRLFNLTEVLLKKNLCLAIDDKSFSPTVLYVCLKLLDNQERNDNLTNKIEITTTKNILKSKASSPTVTFVTSTTKILETKTFNLAQNTDTTSATTEIKLDSTSDKSTTTTIVSSLRGNKEKQTTEITSMKLLTTTNTISLETNPIVKSKRPRNQFNRMMRPGIPFRFG